MISSHQLPSNSFNFLNLSMKNLNVKEQQNIELNRLPRDAAQIIEILAELDNFTSELRKKLMSELKPSGNIIHLKLDNIS